MNKDDVAEENVDLKQETILGKMKQKWFAASDSSGTKKDQKTGKGIVQKIGVQKICILLLLGVLVMLLWGMEGNSQSAKESKDSIQLGLKSTEQSSNTSGTKTTSDTSEYGTALENKLKKILSKVNGVGKVDVMITLSQSKELVILKDSPYTQESVNESDGEGGSRVSDSIKREEETVLSSNKSGETTPYVIKEIQPTVSGVLVIAEGGNDGVIRANIVAAVQALFDVPAHKIVVMEKSSEK